MLTKHWQGLTLETIDEIRAKFPITKNCVFLNHAACSPLPKPVAEAMHKCIDNVSNYGPNHEDLTDLGKTCFAKLVNADIDEVALVENTSVGMNVAANVLRSDGRLKVVTTDLEYPTVVYPFLRKSLGYKVHYVKNVDGKIRLEDIERAVDDKTVAVTISQVEYANGYRFDLKPISEIVHQHGAYLIVDAIQACGAVPVDVKRDNVDFLATACYKWLLSPPGAAFLYVKKELVERFEPPMVGWASVKQDVFNTVDFYDIWRMPYADTASRFEIGSPSVISFIGAREAIKLLLDTGIQNIEKKILKLTDYLIDSLGDLGFESQTPLEPQCRSGIVNFRVAKPKETVDRLAEKGIIISPRANGIRASPHFYNTEEELDRLVEEVKNSER